MVEDLRELQLDVYDTKLGWWTPDHGDIEIPDDWDFLPAGDAFLTRTVKAAGHYWTAWLQSGSETACDPSGAKGWPTSWKPMTPTPGSVI